MTVLLLSVCVFPSYAKTNEIQRIRLAEHADYNRVVIDFSEKPTYQVFTLEQPSRLVFDLDNVEYAQSFKPTIFPKAFIRTLRKAKKAQGQVRLVFELTRSFTQTTQLLPPSSSYPHYRLVVDLKSKKLRAIKIVIDPGHGGKDPGAIGPKRTKEKQVVLGVGKALHQAINQASGFEATLTRRGDYYIGLRKRMEIARKQSADLFIAIHADAFKYPHSHGASVFALSQRGASSEAARWLAEKENYSELSGIENFSDRSHLLRSVLLDLVQTSTIVTSLDLGQQLLNELGKITRLHNKKVEQARFVVLKSPDIPSLLIETGFISNPQEEKKLNTKAYQEKLAQALFKGIKNYYRQHPPPNTYLAMQQVMN